MKGYKILIADDHKMVADGLEMIIRENDLGEVVSKAINGKELLQQLNSIEADLIILDVNMPVLDGLATAELIKLQYPKIKILIISQHESIELINRFVALEVDGYLPKSFEREDLIETIKKIKIGEKEFPTIMDAHNKKFKKILFLNNEKYNLSEREFQIILMIAKGITTRQIAEKLFLSEYTIETHRKNIGRKTGANSSAAIIQFAIDNQINGWVI